MSAARTIPPRGAQQGAALLASLLLVVLIGLSVFLAFSRSDESQAARQRKTDQALAEAKVALIGYAVGRPLDPTDPSRRIGELPCPDRDDDGVADTPCSDEAARLGRLPWRTLGLPDLRDGDGERLWYAVSIVHKNNPRTTCSRPEDPDCLNSDAEGSITVRDATGSVVHDALRQDPPTYRGAIAVVIAPGAILTRQDGTVQARNDATSRSQAANYLDVAHGEDNSVFVDYGPNGFLAGPVRDAASGNTITNDRIAVLAYEDLMPLVERRVTKEVGNCLDAYAAANLGRYPWAADVSTTHVAPQQTITAGIASRIYPDTTGRLTGRVPDTLSNTASTAGGAMSASWPLASNCSLGLGLRWWGEWKLRVFYALAEWYKPGNTAIPTDEPCDPCLNVQKQGGNVVDVSYFVAVAGKRLAGQNRTTNIATLPETLSNPANFLELENRATFSTTGQTALRAGPLDATFNDIAVYKF